MTPIMSGRSIRRPMPVEPGSGDSLHCRPEVAVEGPQRNGRDARLPGLADVRGSLVRAGLAPQRRPQCPASVLHVLQ